MNDRRRRHRTSLAAVAVLCTAGVVGGLIPGSAQAAPGAHERTYRTAGPRISGGESSDNAASLAAGGPRVDSIGNGETRFYSVDLDASSTAYVSAVAIPPPGSGIDAYKDEIRITLTRLDGGRCDAALAGADADDVAHPFGTAVVRQPGSGTSARCGDAGRHLVKVERPSTPTPRAQRWTLEVRHMREPAVKGGPTEQPPKGSWSSQAPLPTTETPRPRPGGTGFNDATALSPGAWKDTVEPGQTRFFKVPVDWGQQLLTSIEVPSPAGSTGKPTGSAGFLSDALGATLYNPGRALLATNHFISYKGDQNGSRIGTAPLAYANRAAHSQAAVRAASVAGWYYVAVSISPEMERYFKDGVPVTVRVHLKGTPRPGPRYDGSATAGGFGVGKDDERAARRGQSAAEVRQSDQLRAVAYGGFALGTALLAGLGAWKLTARRRAASPGASSAAGGGPPGGGSHSGW
ncbi:hypothetical protein [Streptomyces zagrosensis]|uniref:Aromatic ring-opening dioxygenase LigA n=1 Tax=Streptomyces zagrosensis TaxID=1042984 RepID=A0A7W9Q5P5_9ACTN|nr:hypothetical protein [Streptomyces zagrosensis]MBB5934091.1 hypothetical protein [Streptomyces zagrosensis]